MRALIRSAAAAVIALALALVGGVAGAKPPAGAACPLKPGSPSGGDVQWAFSDSGAPSGSHTGIRASYVHGRGSWTSGRATGTACTEETPAKGAVRDLVLSVAGRSKLSPRVTQSGLLGVRIALPIRVRASDDSGCRAGTTGTVTLFASYFSVHRDTMAVHFAKGCSRHDLVYAGPTLHVYIARHGAQVNTAAARGARVPARAATGITFRGAIQRASGRYRHDSGRVTLGATQLVAKLSGPLTLDGATCGTTPRCLRLRGTLHSKLAVIGHPIPDTGVRLSLTGSGTIRPLGHVSAAGLLTLPGNINCGFETVTITLKAAHGTLTLRATTPPSCANMRPGGGSGA